MAVARTQADQRTEIDIADQFQRVWHGSLETSTGDPTGAFNRVGWKDPLRTPQYFLKMRKGTVLGHAWTLFVDFPNWIIQQTEAEENWYKSLIKIASEKYARLDPQTVPFLENDPVVRSVAGPKPWPSSAVLKAAVKGDRQYLGFEKLDKDHRDALGLSTLADVGTSAEIVANAPAVVSAIPSAEAKSQVPPPPDRYQDFVGWAMTWVPECKGNLGKVAQLWKEHAETLKAVGV